MNPNARRILKVAADHRRSRATVRWYGHHASMQRDVAEQALQDLAAEGRATKVEANHGNPVYEVKPE